ncbi:MAG: M48 family metalloprotease, partial [Deltaproteobacteria bacterium]|nr:M48 family metalloprotease [Deltaproteobacteria bacterium]
MNNSRWEKDRLAAKLQSGILLVSLAALLGLLGWMVVGLQMALTLIGAVIVLYWFGPMMSPTVLVKINSGRRLIPAEAPRLHEMLRSISLKAGLERPPALYYLPTEAMLAFTAGLRDHAVIAISDGMMRRLSRQELAAVLAHEISHIRHDDIRIMALAGLAGRFTQLLSVFGQFMLLLSLPMVFMGQLMISWPAIFLLIFSPTLSSLLQLALSRAREYNADMGAAELMGNPGPLASALAKIERVQQSQFSRVLWPTVARMPQTSWLR